MTETFPSNYTQCTKAKHRRNAIADSRRITRNSVLVSAPVTATYLVTASVCPEFDSLSLSRNLLPLGLRAVTTASFPSTPAVLALTESNTANVRGIASEMSFPAAESATWPEEIGFQSRKWPELEGPSEKLSCGDLPLRKLTIPKARVFDFEGQLRKGQAGEVQFRLKYPKLVRLDGKHGDLVMPDGRTIELKTDCHSDSKNLFFERWSNIRHRKPGGPWQSLGHGADFFVYIFLDGREFWFETARLVQWLDKEFHNYEWKEITNKFFVAYGKAIPIVDIKLIVRGVPECLK